MGLKNFIKDIGLFSLWMLIGFVTFFKDLFRRLLFPKTWTYITSITYISLLASTYFGANINRMLMNSLGGFLIICILWEEWYKGDWKHYWRIRAEERLNKKAKELNNESK